MGTVHMAITGMKQIGTESHRNPQLRQSGIENLSSVLTGQ